MLCYIVLYDIICLEGSDYMSLFLKQSKFKNGKIYLSIVDGYRINGKVKQKVYQKLGLSLTLYNQKHLSKYYKYLFFYTIYTCV